MLLALLLDNLHEIVFTLGRKEDIISIEQFVGHYTLDILCDNVYKKNTEEWPRCTLTEARIDSTLETSNFTVGIVTKQFNSK